MLFNSYEFIFVFLPIVLIGFFVIARQQPHAAITWLVIASLFFYGWWNPKYIFLIISSIIFNYTIGIALSTQRYDYLKIQRSYLLFLGVTGNLALLSYYKYANFFVDTVNHLANTNWHLTEVILPIGISFFTFQQIAYLVDNYQGKSEEHNFVQYCLFVCFFPQFIAGPIVHHKEMLPQFRLTSTYSPKLKNLAIGVTIFGIGLAKKTLIADNLALIASPIFETAENGHTLHFFQAWRGAFAYTLQLYFDFSGYSDMAIGLARMFGIRLPLNFHSPYRATSIIDFWRRWHMTLSRFLKDYVYIPLGGNRRGRPRLYINLLTTMLLGGLWHGASWTFVFWGGMHGIYLVINLAWRFVKGKSINRWWSRLVARLLTFFFVVIAWVFFRAETFDGAIAILRGMVNLPHTLAPILGSVTELAQNFGIRFDGPYVRFEDLQSIGYLVLWMIFLWVVPNTQQWMEKIRPAYNYPFKEGSKIEETPRSRLFKNFYWKPNLIWAVTLGIIFAAGVLSLSQISEFIYFQF